MTGLAIYLGVVGFVSGVIVGAVLGWREGRSSLSWQYWDVASNARVTITHARNALFAELRSLELLMQSIKRRWPSANEATGLQQSMIELGRAYELLGQSTVALLDALPPRLQERVVAKQPTTDSSDAPQRRNPDNRGNMPPWNPQ